MNEFDAPRSVIAPLFLGYSQPAEDYSGISDAFIRALQAVPKTAITLKVKVGTFKHERVPSSRELVLVTPTESQYHRMVRCVDRHLDEQQADAVNRWIWEAGYRNLKKGVLAPAIPADLDPIEFQVSRFRIHDGGVKGAAQLALFRHLFVMNLRALDSDVIVCGGQHEWTDDMWTVPTPTLDETV